MHASIRDFFLLGGLGCLVGAYGTLIGAGGGFLLVPVLLLMFPEQTPAAITAMSLAVVFFMPTAAPGPMPARSGSTIGPGCCSPRPAFPARSWARFWSS